MPLFTICNISLSSKYPTDHLLYDFENAYFEWKQKHCVFVHVSLMSCCPLPLFQNRAVPLQLVPQILC